MSLLVLILLVLGVFALGTVLPTRWAGTFTSVRSRFEDWSAQSWWRIFGLPLLLAGSIVGLAALVGEKVLVGQIFGNAFLAFIIFSVFLSARVAHVRLGIKMMFLTVLFGTVLSLLVH